MHTINKDNNPDTLSLDPIYTYKLVVHTKPEVILDNIKLIPGKHNTIEANTPQGELMLKVQGNQSLFTGINAKDAEFIQYLRPVLVGPSSKRCPK